MLMIDDLHASVDGKAVLKGLTLHVNKGEIHALMGPNGAGKSTLANLLAGHPSYEVTRGEIYFEGANLLDMEPEERAHLGLFMSFQYPPEIPGVTILQFLKEALNAKRKAQKSTPLSSEEFEKLLEEKMQLIQMPSPFKERMVNDGFSGGEKKRNEILQMAMLEPKLAILDETDSGLDIDALRIIACGVKKLLNSEKGLILITHYQRLLDYICPHFVHILYEGRIVQSGGADLAHVLEDKGYDWVKKG